MAKLTKILSSLLLVASVVVMEVPPVTLASESVAGAMFLVGLLGFVVGRFME